MSFTHTQKKREDFDNVLLLCVMITSTIVPAHAGKGYGRL